MRAGRDVDAHIVQHGRVAAVREPDVRHRHGERAVFEMYAVGGFGDVDRHVEHREDLAPSGDRGLGLVEDLAQLADRAQQEVDQEHERDDLADVESPVIAVVRRRHHNAGERDGAEEVAEREHRGEVLRGADPGSVRAVDALLQSHPSALLQPVGADDRGAADGLGELRDHVADARPFLVVGLQLPTLEGPEQRDDRCVRDQREECQLPGVDEHHDERADDQRAVDQPRDHPPLHEASQGFDVARDACHEDAAPGRGVFGHAQAVDVVEDTHAQVAQRLLGGAHQSVVGEAADEEHTHRDRDGAQAREQHELGPEAARAEHTAVEDDLDQDRDCELAQCGNDREHDRRLEAVAQLGTRRQAAAQHLQRARRDTARRRGIVVLERGEDPFRELVAGLGRRRVGDDVVRGAVDGASLASSSVRAITQPLARRRAPWPRSRGWSRGARGAIPVATMRPSCMNNTRSASAIVETRWATISVVMSSSSRSPRRIRASTVASTADVASSSNRNRGRRISARASAMRCRWPPDTVTPRSPIDGLVPRRQRIDEPRHLRDAGRPSQSSVSLASVPIVMLFAIVSVNRNDSWNTSATLRAQIVCG